MPIALCSPVVEMQVEAGAECHTASVKCRNAHMVASRVESGALHSLWQSEKRAQPVARLLPLLDGSHRAPLCCLWGPSRRLLAKGLILQQSMNFIALEQWLILQPHCFKMQWCCGVAHSAAPQLVSRGHAAQQDAGCCRAPRGHQSALGRQDP